MERERIIGALKICDSNYDGIVCVKCPIKDDDYNGAWSDEDGACYQHLMREAAGLLSAQPDATSDTISCQAVKYLDLFTKTYCRDESATDDLVFRCSDCEFELRPSGKCLVKCMARKLCPDYKDFGSMGDL